jgi:hypothetical protein
MIDTEGLNKSQKLRLIFVQILLVVALPAIILSYINNPLLQIILFLLWVGTIDNTSPFIQKHFTNKFLGIKK